MARSIAVRLLSWVALCGIAIAFIPTAYAGTLKSNNPPYTVGSQTFGLSIGGTVAAGGFSGTFEGNPIQFWCAELTQYFTPGSPYVYTESLPNDATFTMLGELFHEAYGVALSDAAHSAAFQLAIWEILYDGDLDLLGASGFHVTDNHGHGATVTMAQDWLNHLGSYTDNYDVFLLHNETHQDFITPGPPQRREHAPEPTPLALIGVGLVAMIVASRRRATDTPTH